MLTLGPILDTLRRHGCCVFLRQLAGADFAVGHGVGCVAHRGGKAGCGRRGSTTSWCCGSTGEGRGGAAAHHLQTFLRRQKRRLLHGIFAAEHGEDADAVECSPEFEVASGPAPTHLHVSRSRCLVSGWIDKQNCFFIFWGDTVCT